MRVEPNIKFLQILKNTVFVPLWTILNLFIIRGRCENLVEEYEYMFRVLAVNKGGRGHPGPQSQSVIAMYKNIPPSIKVR